MLLESQGELPWLAIAMYAARAHLSDMPFLTHTYAPSVVGIQTFSECEHS
jgi:hypothetical protein